MPTKLKSNSGSSSPKPKITIPTLSEATHKTIATMTPNSPSVNSTNLPFLRHSKPSEKTSSPPYSLKKYNLLKSPVKSSKINNNFSLLPLETLSISKSQNIRISSLRSNFHSSTITKMKSLQLKSIKSTHSTIPTPANSNF
jgi:hypothetical protein